MSCKELSKEATLANQWQYAAFNIMRTYTDEHLTNRYRTIKHRNFRQSQHVTSVLI